ncbi:hypothetical protein ABZ690_08530 [Streptomyces sp. NPDC006967]
MTAVLSAHAADTARPVGRGAPVTVEVAAVLVTAVAIHLGHRGSR